MINRADPTIVKVRAIINFPKLYEPETDPWGRTRYACEFRVKDPADWDKIEAAKEAAWKKKDPANWQKMLKKTNADPKLCLLRLPDDFDELEENERYKVMNLSRRPEDRMPELLGPDLHKVAQSEGLFVSGAEVFVLFSVWSFTGKGSTGCSGTMLGLQFIKAGPSLGGAAKKASADDFEKLEQDEADEDPFAVEKVPF